MHRAVIFMGHRNARSLPTLAKLLGIQIIFYFFWNPSLFFNTTVTSEIPIQFVLNLVLKKIKTFITDRF